MWWIVDKCFEVAMRFWPRSRDQKKIEALDIRIRENAINGATETQDLDVFAKQLRQAAIGYAKERKEYLHRVFFTQECLRWLLDVREETIHKIIRHMIANKELSRSERGDTYKFL